MFARVKKVAIRERERERERERAGMVLVEEDGFDSEYLGVNSSCSDDEH